MAKLLVATAVAAALANVGPAGAQVRPARPIAIMVPAAAGGPIVRPMAACMQTLLGQPVLIGHVDGSASRLAVERLAWAVPDRYKLRGAGTIDAGQTRYRQPGHVRRKPMSRASATAWARFDTPSLPKIADT